MNLTQWGIDPTGTVPFYSLEYEMASVNKVVLIGELMKAPELVQSAVGLVAVLAIQTVETKKDYLTGDTFELVQTHRVLVFPDDQPQETETLLKVGNNVYLEGSLYLRKVDKSIVSEIHAKAWKPLGRNVK